MSLVERFASCIEMISHIYRVGKEAVIALKSNGADVACGETGVFCFWIIVKAAVQKRIKLPV